MGHGPTGSSYATRYLKIQAHKKLQERCTGSGTAREERVILGEGSQMVEMHRGGDMKDKVRVGFGGIDPNTGITLKSIFLCKKRKKNKPH